MDRDRGTAVAEDHDRLRLFCPHADIAKIRRRRRHRQMPGAWCLGWLSQAATTRKPKACDEQGAIVDCSELPVKARYSVYRTTCLGCHSAASLRVRRARLDCPCGLIKYRLFTLWAETNMLYSNLLGFWPPHCRNALFFSTFLCGDSCHLSAKWPTNANPGTSGIRAAVRRRPACATSNFAVGQRSRTPSPARSAMTYARR